jgi:hypothetical protein
MLEYINEQGEVFDLERIDRIKCLLLVRGDTCVVEINVSEIGNEGTYLLLEAPGFVDFAIKPWSKRSVLIKEVREAIFDCFYFKETPGFQTTYKVIEKVFKKFDCLGGI